MGAVLQSALALAVAVGCGSLTHSSVRLVADVGVEADHLVLTACDVQRTVYRAGLVDAGFEDLILAALHTKHHSHSGPDEYRQTAWTSGCVQRVVGTRESTALYHLARSAAAKDDCAKVWTLAAPLRHADRFYYVAAFRSDPMLVRCLAELP